MPSRPFLLIDERLLSHLKHQTTFTMVCGRWGLHFSLTSEGFVYAFISLYFTSIVRITPATYFAIVFFLVIEKKSLKFNNPTTLQTTTKWLGVSLPSVANVFARILCSTTNSLMVYQRVQLFELSELHISNNCFRQHNSHCTPVYCIPIRSVCSDDWIVCHHH